MCGIAGIINVAGRLSQEELERTVAAMSDVMVHRGPDDFGYWVDPQGYCALGQRRLAIIDLSPEGHQPRASGDGGATITFNGELFNYLELREGMAKRGFKFRGRTDTEVILEFVREQGERAYAQLDGMYAFGIFDHASRKLTLARDPFGKKPLYYAAQNGWFAFASELHAFAAIPGFDAEIDPDAISDQLCFQYIHAPRTIYKHVKKLPPGHFLELAPGGEPRIHRHFEYSPGVDVRPFTSMDALADELEEILIRSVKRRMISDVPLGGFLSGGVDSSLVVALMSKVLGHEVKTFSIGFDGTDETEHVYARQVAEHLGTEHREKVLKPDALSLAEKIGRVQDEPNGDSSCLPTYLLSQFTREHVTVALSGDGGDEMFGGYGRYFSTLQEEERKAKGDSALKQWNPGDAYFSHRILIFSEGDLARLYGKVPPATAELLRALKERVNATDRDLLARLRGVDAMSYMPGAVLAKVDRMSMQHSLEVRSPLLGIEVARFASRLPREACYRDGSGKLLLKHLASRYLPREWMERKKMGFGLPMSLWGRGQLLGTTKKLVLGQGAMLPRWIERKRLQEFIRGQEIAFSTYQVWNLLILEIWLRNHPATGGRLGTEPGFWGKLKEMAGRG